MKLAVAILGLTILVKAQVRPTFRADVSQVHVDVEVLSKEGRIVSGLGKSDFRVFDEGQEQTVVGFASEEQPLDVILLFDISGSMRRKLAWATAAAGQALKELKHGDRVSIMTFSDQTGLLRHTHLATTDR
jgi:Ca-activated chloride channel homolog